jgi:hypothetical protein
MAKILHLVKRADMAYPWDLILPRAGSDACSVVLIHDAVSARPPLTCPTFVLASDAQARGVDVPYPLIDDTRLLDLIWDADSVVVW